jgi:peptide-methionine (S)-S-oxide reductase
MRTLSLAVLAIALAAAAPAAVNSAPEDAAITTFAGGCFWCMEEAFEKVQGVVEVVSGYMGGSVANPTYQQVSAGRTGHAEVIQITYREDQVSYAELLDVFWRNIDPTTPNRQFCDGGNQYRAEIFFHGSEQQSQAEASLAQLRETKPFAEPIVTAVSAASEFYPAEDYHQDYYKKNPTRYKFYKWNCGRAQRLEELWGAG